MTLRFFKASLLIGTLLLPALAAQDTVAPKIEIIGKAAIVEGQFVHGSYTFETNGTPNSPYTREPLSYRPWVNDVIAELGIRANLNQHFSAVACPQIRLWNDTWDWTKMYQDAAPYNPFTQHMTVSLADAEGIATFGSKEALAFTAATGVFPFKYDADAKNLGEYLFRTGEHPAYVQTAFDNAYVTLTGFRFNADFLNRFSLTALFTQETQVIPINDWSLSFIAGYNAPKLFNVGAGVMFDRLCKVNPIQAESPVTATGLNTYYTSDGILDTLSWGGTKLMAHASFDIKGILPAELSGIFGKEDLKIYGEVAVLGLNNITAYRKTISGTDTTLSIDSNMNFYSDIKQRIPVMVGFNIPMCNILDYLSVEGEYNPWPYSPSLYNYQSQLYTLPQPIIPVSPTGDILLKTSGNSWKWSVNFRKTVWDHLSIIGQIAKDHTRHDVYYAGYSDPEEVFTGTGDWGWWFKLQYSL